jgi:hypothetical protein
MPASKRLLAACAAAAVAVLVCCRPLDAQSNGDPASAKPAAGVTSKVVPTASGDAIAQQERQIAEKYKHLEDVLLRMAELTEASDPRRAALLRKAVAQSKDELIGVRFDRLVELLGKTELSGALENETELDRDLRSMLALLMSENREQRIKDERDRVASLVQQVAGIIREEKDIQGRTISGDDTQRLSKEQGAVADKTGKVAQDMEGKGGTGKEKTPDKKADDGNKQTPGQKAESGKGQPTGKAESGKGGESGKGKSKGKPSGGSGKSSGQPPSGDDDDKKESGGKGQGQQQKQAPARERIVAAQQAMEKAKDKIKKAEKEGAVQDEEEAINELEKAKAALEAILRQLREEEIGRILAMLEARFKKMLQMEEEVYAGTLLLDKTPIVERTHNDEIEAGRLSGKQSEIVVEVDKAALVLREDGSAVAFPEAVDQMRDDMQQVVERLAQAKVEKITQGVEEDVIASLKEMIAALKKAQKEKKKEEKKPPPGKGGPPSEPEEPKLVDPVAELKMIRALQVRVNVRTTKYSKLIEGEQADNPELVEAIRQLAERQQRIYRVTHDMQSGKTR